MKKVLPLLIALIFLSGMVLAQKKVSLRITCAPENIHIKNLCPDTLNKYLYVCYTYGESYKTLSYEIAKYDGKDWKVIAKFDKMKKAKWDAEEPKIKQMCVVGNVLYIYGNMTQCEQGKELKEYDNSYDVFKYDNGNWSLLKSEKKPRNLVVFNNSIWADIAVDRTFCKWTGSDWEAVGEPMKDFYFKYPSYAVFNNSLYAILSRPVQKSKFDGPFVAKFDGKKWNKVEFTMTDFEKEDFTPMELFVSNGKFFISGANRKSPVELERLTFVYDNGQMTRILKNYTDFLTNFPHPTEFYNSRDGKFTAIVSNKPKANPDSLCAIALTCNLNGDIISAEQLLTYSPRTKRIEVVARDGKKIYIGYATINQKSASTVPVLDCETKENRLYYFELK